MQDWEHRLRSLEHRIQGLEKSIQGLQSDLSDIKAKLEHRPTYGGMLVLHLALIVGLIFLPILGLYLTF